MGKIDKGYSNWNANSSIPNKKIDITAIYGIIDT